MQLPMPPVRAMVAVVLVATLAGCGGGGSADRPSATPVDASFELLAGGRSSLAALRGKPVVVNFFSSTCIPCASEMPAFEQVKGELEERVTFLGMNVQDTVAAGRSFVETVKVTWELGRDPDGSILQSLGGLGLPTTLILDAGGHMVFKHLGALEADDLRAELAELGTS